MIGRQTLAALLTRPTSIRRKCRCYRIELESSESFLLITTVNPPQKSDCLVNGLESDSTVMQTFSHTQFFHSKDRIRFNQRNSRRGAYPPRKESGTGTVSSDELHRFRNVFQMGTWDVQYMRSILQTRSLRLSTVMMLSTLFVV
jgi:hypothetical protein